MKRKLIYLDQSYWGRLAGGETELRGILECVVKNGHALCPVSMMHWLETMKAHPDVRTPLITLFKELSQGWFLINTFDVMRLEYDRHHGKHSLNWIQDRIITRDPLAMLTPMKPWWARVLSWLVTRFVSTDEMLPVLLNIERTAKSSTGVDKILSDGAARASSGTCSEFDRIRLAHSIGVRTKDIPEDKDARDRLFPSITIRERLQSAITKAVPSGMEGNDLIDVGFLSLTLAYFDVVTVDRRMGSRVREAELGDLLHANVIHKIDQLGSAVLQHDG